MQRIRGRLSSMSLGSTQTKPFAPRRGIAFFPLYVAAELIIHGVMQRWNGSFFERTTLYDLGLSVYLGHHGRPCRIPVAVPDSPFTVLHTNGVHKIKLFRCGCEVADPIIDQLLAFGWFPATSKQPASAISFQALREFQALTHQCKYLSAYHYCYGVARMQDGTNLSQTSVSRPITLR